MGGLRELSSVHHYSVNPLSSKLIQKEYNVTCTFLFQSIQFIASITYLSY